MSIYSVVRFECVEVNAAGEQTVHEVTATQTPGSCPSDEMLLIQNLEWHYVIDALNLPLVRSSSTRFHDVNRSGRVFRIRRGSHSRVFPMPAAVEVTSPSSLGSCAFGRG